MPEYTVVETNEYFYCKLGGSWTPINADPTWSFDSDEALIAEHPNYKVVASPVAS